MGMAGFISRVENLEVMVDSPARVIIDEVNGVIVMGEAVLAKNAAVECASYVVDHCAAHFCVIGKLVLSVSDCCGGDWMIGAPNVVEPSALVLGGGAVCARYRQLS